MTAAEAGSVLDSTSHGVGGAIGKRRADASRGACDKSEAVTASSPASADPSGDLTVFEAIGRQLGLKLAQTKRPVPVVVINQLERRPAANQPKTGG